MWGGINLGGRESDVCEPSRHGGERFAAAERTHTAPHGVWLHGDGLRPVFAHGRPDAEPGTART